MKFQRFTFQVLSNDNIWHLQKKNFQFGHFFFLQQRNLPTFLEDETRMLEEMEFNTRQMVTWSSHDPPWLLKVLKMHKVFCRLTVMKRCRRYFPTSLFMKKCSMDISIFWNLILKKWSFATTHITASWMVYLDIEPDLCPRLGKLVGQKFCLLQFVNGKQ